MLVAESSRHKYPKGVSVDFSKLDREALLKIIDHYGVAPSQSKSDYDLACIAARYFEAFTPLENDVVDSFARKFCHSGSDPKKTQRSSGGTSAAKGTEILRVGEQAAARVSKSDENGSWILVNVLYYDASTDRYEVQDEDDISRIMKLDASDVRKLEDLASRFRRGDKVLAVFPETTSFYSAVVAKNPKSGGGGDSSSPEELIVRFDDDEDDMGKPIARRIPARFVFAHHEEDGEDGDSDES